MRAALMTAIIVGVGALIFGVVGAFYVAAGVAGVLSEALFGRAYVGVAIANAVTLLLVFVMIVASLLTLAERKWSALMQDRIGPNRARVGLPGVSRRSLLGIPHFLADGIKMLTKEDFVPGLANKGLYTLAPMLAFGTVFMLFAIVPMAPVIPVSEIPIAGALAASMGVTTAFDVSLQVIPNLDIGLLFVFAFAGIAVFGVALAGWASNNRLALLGGVRGASQMIAYEIPLGLSLVGLMMAYQTLNLEVMTAAQSKGVLGGLLPAWGVFLQPFGFLAFFIASLAETKRAPFNAPEGEAEIVGFFLEYSGMRFGLFMISEFVEIVVLSGVTVAVFLGGFHLPLPPAWGAEAWLAANIGTFGLKVVQGATFVFKVLLLCWVQLAIRWTLVSFRWDQIQRLGWKMLLPIALVNIFVSGVLIIVDPTLNLMAVVGLAQLALILGLTALYPAKRPGNIVYASERGAAAVDLQGR